MNWCAVRIEVGRARAVQNNLTRLGLRHYLPLETRCVRISRLSKAKQLVEHPIIPDMVFMECDIGKVNRFLATKYTLRPVTDRHEVMIRIPDSQMTAFQERLEVWNEGVRKQFEGGQTGTRKQRKAFRQMTLETLQALSSELFGVVDIQEAA